MFAQNGHPVLETSRTDGALPRLRKWAIPGTGRHLFLRDGSVGFVLVHLALWFHEKVERLDLGVWDEWGWAVRPVRGQVNGYSNHAAGAAADLNATRHPRGVLIAATFTPTQVKAIRRRLRLYVGVIRWGGDYVNSPADGMHFEVVKDLPAAERLARVLIHSPRGRRILDANPGAKAVILS